ncbi:helix-turn-helix domain-containing protein, partial [Limosilactobacillus reuteri]
MYPQSWKSTLGVFYMTKISVKTKLKENLASISETCIHFGYRSPGSVYQWECLYNKQGPQALLRLRRGRKPKNGQTT